MGFGVFNFPGVYIIMKGNFPNDFPYKREDDFSI